MADVMGGPVGNPFRSRGVGVAEYSTSRINTNRIGQTIDEIVRYEMIRRKGFERRWYDNNFFDDGFHFRFLSRSTNKIVDLSERSNIYTPQRAIPKASRQIRGITNLLVSNDPTPVVYPDRIDKTAYPQQYQQDPQTGQQVPVDNPAYTKALEESERVAKHTGYWLEEEMKSQELVDKLTLMVLLACKHSVSWMQVWPDNVNEKIRSQVYDAFDIICRGTLTDPYDSPYIIKVTPQLINEIKANEDFDPQQLELISPDNKQASSEIKTAYMNARYNQGGHIDASATLLLKEAYLKEYLNPDNMAKLRGQKDGQEILKNRKEGDPVIRQVFVAGNVWLRDRYTNLPEYPFVDYRMEPGNIYQVPIIERFIPQNKTLDTLVSRAERYANAMVTGTWLKRQGEQFSVNNIAGGQVIEYATTPPTQAEIQPIPQFFFELIQYISALIEEQGTTTATLGKVPSGVKANAAIESLKESEYANLVMASRRLKTTIKRIAERFLDIADHTFITPQTVYYLEKGKPQYFDVIGHSALEGRKKLKIGTSEDIVPIKGDYRIDIEIESGLGFTKEGQKTTMLQLFQALDPYVQQGMINPQAFKVVIEQFLQTYQFGATAEFMDAMDKYGAQQNWTEQQLLQIKTAVLEALKEAGEVGQEASDKRIMENKVGTAEALQETGVIQGVQNGQPQPQAQKPPSVGIQYKDLPPEGQVQAAAEAGIIVTPDQIVKEQQRQALAEHVLQMAKGGANGGSKSASTGRSSNNW